MYKNESVKMHQKSDLVQMRTDFTKIGLKKESGTEKSITIR